MTYTLMIAKDGEMIAEREATPDMVIALLAEMATNNPTPQLEVAATHIETSGPKKSRSRKETVVTRTKGAKVCKKCGKPGHMAKTCTAPAPAPATPTFGDKHLLDEDQFDALKHLQSIGDLISKDFALDHDLPLAQVNRAISCRNFEEYLNF